MTTEQMDALDDERARQMRELVARQTRERFWLMFSPANPALTVHKRSSAIRRIVDRFAVTLDWAVYEHRTGVPWQIDPATETNARREAALAGEGHEAMPLGRARELANAFAHGRASRR